MKCSNCGSNVPANAKFCGVCGTPLSAPKAEAATETVALDTSASPEMKAAAQALENVQTVAMESVTANTDVSEPVAEKSVDSGKSEPAEPSSESTGQSKAAQADAASSTKEASETPKSTDDTSDKKGKFRETIWFMQADDPEMMSAIENEELESREATYQDPGGQLDERSREKFSLNISDSSMMKAMERDALENDTPAENSKGWFYASMVLGSIAFAAGIYFAFFT